MLVGRPALVLGAYTINGDSDESARLARAFIVGVLKVYSEMMTQAKYTVPLFPLVRCE